MTVALNEIWYLVEPKLHDMQWKWDNIWNTYAIWINFTNLFFRYYAAPASDEPVQVYNIRMSDNLQQNSINNESGGGYIDVVNDYEEIDKDEIECQSIQDSPHYLELD